MAPPRSRFRLSPSIWREGGNHRPVYWATGKEYKFTLSPTSQLSFLLHPSSTPASTLTTTTARPSTQFKPLLSLPNTSLHISQNATKGRRQEARHQGTSCKGTSQTRSWKEDQCDRREEEENKDAQGDLLFIHLQRYVFSESEVALRSQDLARQQHHNIALNGPHLPPTSSSRVFSSTHLLTFELSVLKQVHPDTGISNRAMSILNSFVNGKPHPIQSVPAHLT